MNKRTYFEGIPGVKWGVWNGVDKRFVYGISEDTPYKAREAFDRLAKDHQRRQWRYEVKQIPEGWTQPKSINPYKGAYR